MEKMKQNEVLQGIATAPNLVLTMALLNFQSVRINTILKLKDRISIATVTANKDTESNLATLLCKAQEAGERCFSLIMQRKTSILNSKGLI